ncbi:hypothetical protein CHUAL_001069 [Chamberlinius hualienensis]
MSAEKPLTSKDYAERGNKAVKDGQFFQAALNYTFAIKLDLRNAELYSNRSFAFLKTGQLYYALEDADQTIKLRPQWAKGYFRKAEVLFAANQFIEAAEIYQEAHRLQPSDATLLNYIKKCHAEVNRIKKQDEQMPWLGSAVGLLLGILVVLLEYTVLQNSFLPHVIAQAFVVLLVGVAGYFIAVVVRNNVRSYRDSMIEKPVDLMGEN